MVKPDVIVAWPISHDYPLWRQFIRDNRERFAKVIVSVTQHDGTPMIDFVREAMCPDDVTFIDARATGSADWRDVAVNLALNVSDAEWVWFTEQDFFITEPEYFWRLVNELCLGDEYSKPVDAYGRYDDAEASERDHFIRNHPSCLFVRRSLIEATSRNFGVTPRGDHFAQFSDEILRVPNSVIMLMNGYGWEHLQGLTQNHWLIDSGQEAGRFKMNRFDQYLRDCLAVTVPLDSDWAERSRRHLRAQAA